jgi:hypothetical protein
MSSPLVSDSSISDLDMAALYFGIEYTRRQDKIINIKPAGKVKPVVEIMDKKYYEKEYEAYEKGNDHRVLVRKQENNTRYNWENPSKDDTTSKPISIILGKEIKKNGLGIEDEYYFYVIFRKKTLDSWSRSLDIKKYIRTPGIYIPFSILKHIDNQKVKEVSELCLVLGDGRIYTIPSRDLFKYFFKHKMPLLINAYGQMMTAAPLEIFNRMGN